MKDVATDGARAILGTYRVGSTPLFVVGAFDKGVTVLSQQIRALNFVWAAIESGSLQCDPPQAERAAPSTKIAIVGGGFAGLTLCAALLKKRVSARISFFEQRDTILPLQHGSDSRWLHPRIYDWPGEGAEASVAMLPVLNWTAARASDVVVQILAEWKSIVSDSPSRPALYCNARHLQIHEVMASSPRLQIEWVGESRDPADARTIPESGSAEGRSDDFDLVILATGFGLERDGARSYWRNETIGQPSLDQPRQMFLVSGQGDGAMIDLLRLRISQFRQDRILGELFRERQALLRAIKRLHAKYSHQENRGLFAAFEGLEGEMCVGEDLREVRRDLMRRLRRDTDVILHLKVKKLSELFDCKTARISFQNKLLVYLLYKCGGFIPSILEEEELIKQYSVTADRIVRRHGTYRNEQLESVLSHELYCRMGITQAEVHLQTDKECWPGGYFGIPGALKDAGTLGDKIRVDWRKEYLPGPTELLANAFCGSIAGALMAQHPEAGRLRVTLHRSVSFGSDELLQQACDYRGTCDARESSSAAARTFPVNAATIGIAYRCRRIVRSRRNIERENLRATMTRLGLNVASREMSREVRFILAIPLLEPEEPGRYTAPSPVVGVVYIDSTAPDFFIDDAELSQLLSMTQEFLNALEQPGSHPFGRILNLPLSKLGGEVPAAKVLPENVEQELELLSHLAPPKTSGPFQLNYDYSDFVPAQDVAR